MILWVASIGIKGLVIVAWHPPDFIKLFHKFSFMWQDSLATQTGTAFDAKRCYRFEFVRALQILVKCDIHFSAIIRGAILKLTLSWRIGLMVGRTTQRRERAMRQRLLLILFCSFGLVPLMLGCGSENIAEKELGVELATAGMDPLEASILKTNVSEKIVLELAPQLRKIGQALEGEPVTLRSLASDKIEIQNLLSFDLTEAVLADREARESLTAKVSWPIEQTAKEVGHSQFKDALWAAVSDSSGNKVQFEDVSLGVLRGDLLDDAKTFHMKTVFEGRFKNEIRNDQEQVFGVKAKQTLDWELGQGNVWRVKSWQQDSFDVTVVNQPLFSDVTESVFEKGTARNFSISPHKDLILKRARNPQMEAQMSSFFRFFVDWDSTFRYNSASVVDFDQDGWDDLFVADRWGKAQLLRNINGEKFEDVTETCGMKLGKTGINCSLFVDFDNDGDLDALLGESVDTTTFYRNVDGKFVADETVNKQIANTRFVTCASAIDINRDGLMDVYLSTYATGGAKDFGWLEYIASPEELPELKERVLKSHAFLDRCGPPNIVLMNRNGNLERVAIDDTLKQWKCSYQSVWSDVDNDGDDDLYICNDFAPDALLRNDTPRGSLEPAFTNISSEVFEAKQMGFGMGASFGDYDSDGDLDLYVSNMYSKAGNRVFSQIGGNVSDQVKLAAQGNFLFRKNGDQFEQVAGFEEGQQNVSKVGWSFGGQFADFNNDAKLDLYVPSGFFTPPDVVDSKADL